MAGGGAIRAGRAFVELFADDSKLRKGLNRASRSMKNFSAKVGRIGGVVSGAALSILAPLGAAAKKFADVGDQVDKISQRTGVTASALSELGFSAEQSGTDLETVEKGLLGMSRTMLNAEQGLTSSTDALDELGLTVDDLAGKSPDEQFEILGEAIRGVADPSKQSALAMRIFGKSGAQLLPMFKAGAKGIAEMRQEARELGFSLSEEDAKSAAELTDAMNRMRRAIGGVVQRIGAALAPVLTKAANAAAMLVARVTEFVKNNSGTIRIIAAIGAFLGLAGAALLTVAGAASLAGFALAGISTVLGILFSPIVLIGGAIAGVTAALIYFSGVGGTVVEYLKGKFGELWNYLKPTFEAISNALSSGEYGKAAEILWLQLKAAWLQGTASLQKLWIGFKVEFAKTIVEGTVAALNTWDNFAGGVMDIWDSVTNHIIDAWKFVQTKIAGLIVDVMAYFDPTIDADEAKADLEAARTRDAEKRDSERDSRIVGRERDRDAKSKERREAADATIDTLNEDLGRELDGVDNAITMARKNLDEARGQFADPDPSTLNGKDSADIESFAAAQGNAVSQAKNIAGGTFSTLAGRQIGVGGVAEKQLKVLDKIATNTEKAAKNKSTPAAGG